MRKQTRIQVTAPSGISATASSTSQFRPMRISRLSSRNSIAKTAKEFLYLYLRGLRGLSFLSSLRLRINNLAMPDGRLLYSHVICDPLDVMGKLAALVPPPRFNLVITASPAGACSITPIGSCGSRFYPPQNGWRQQRATSAPNSRIVVVVNGKGRSDHGPGQGCAAGNWICSTSTGC